MADGDQTRGSERSRAFGHWLVVFLLAVALAPVAGVGTCYYEESHRLRETERVSGLTLKDVPKSSYIQQGREEGPSGWSYRITAFDLPERLLPESAECPAGFTLAGSESLASESRALDFFIAMDRPFCMKQVVEGEARHVLVVQRADSGGGGRLVHYRMEGSPSPVLRR